LEPVVERPLAAGVASSHAAVEEARKKGKAVVVPSKHDVQPTTAGEPSKKRGKKYHTISINPEVRMLRGGPLNALMLI